MTRPVTVPNVFGSLSGNLALSLIDSDLSVLQAAINDPASYVNYAIDTGIANVYAATYSPAPSSLTDGLVLVFRATNANTGSSTFNPNAIGAKPIVDTAGAALAQGAIVANQTVVVAYSTQYASWMMVTNDASAGHLLTANTWQSVQTFNNSVTFNVAPSFKNPAIYLYSYTNFT